MEFAKQINKMTDKSLKTVDPKKRVTLYGTESSQHHNVGEPFEASALVADKLISMGRATKEAPVVKSVKPETAPTPILK